MMFEDDFDLPKRCKLRSPKKAAPLPAIAMEVSSSQSNRFFELDQAGSPLPEDTTHPTLEEQLPATAQDRWNNTPNNHEETVIHSISGSHVMANEMVINNGETSKTKDERQAIVGGTQSKGTAQVQPDSTAAQAQKHLPLSNRSEYASIHRLDLTSTVEVLEPLIPEEESERHRLELKVERAFYEAGSSLRELRDQRLYRSTYATFEEYCRERFGFTHRHVNYLIAASHVVENLQMGTISSQSGDIQMGTNSSQILPTSETQVRPLASFEPNRQRELWQQAVKDAGGKIPSARIVKGIVERLKERDTTPPTIPYQVGDVVEIRAGSNPALRKHDGCWGIVTHVGSFSSKVHISVRTVDVQCKPDEMDNVDPKYTADVQAVSTRIAALAKHDLDPAVWSILETLNRQTCFTQIQLDLLAWAEERYLAH